jgi:hypothetical protein
VADAVKINFLKVLSCQSTNINVPAAVFAPNNWRHPVRIMLQNVPNAEQRPNGSSPLFALRFPIPAVVPVTTADIPVHPATAAAINQVIIRAPKVFAVDSFKHEQIFKL